MALTVDERNEAARALAAAARDRQPVPPITDRHAAMTVDDAYAIQLANVAVRLVAGEAVAGHKVGLTNAVMQELFGASSPTYGHLFEDTVVRSGESLARRDFCAPRVEPEIAFMLGHRLQGPGITVDDVMAATDAVAPAIEIADSRIIDWKVTLVDLVADNSAAGAVVVGAWTKVGDAPSLPDVPVELVVNDEIAGSGRGDAVLGHPAAAVAWLANTVAAFDVTLEAGHLVMPGSCTAAPFVGAGDRVEARFDGIGEASILFT